ncbi:hypothetical protein [Roseateles sp.]|uniref:hypothetical protein n=1 Tax=Roseateles sp. TaxID=1971397 RepID=UPI0035A05354
MTSGLRASILCCAALAALALSGCGGGGGAKTDTPPPSGPRTLAVSGAAYAGAALANAAVESKCASGVGSATTAANGSYTLAIPQAQLPCVLRVKQSDGSWLYSLATGSGDSATANLSPLTLLVVARHAGGAAAGYYDGFGASAAGALTPAAAQAATAAVALALKDGGFDPAPAGDPLTASLGAGTAQAQFIDTLGAALKTSQSSWPDLATALAASQGTAPSATPSLPAAALLQPAAANCASLRSGKARLVVNEPGTTQPSTKTVTLDATTLTVTDGKDGGGTLQAQGVCRLTNPASGAEFVVTSAGLAVARISSNGPVLRGALLFPEQTHALAALAGDWNLLGFDRVIDGGPVQLVSQTFSLDASGKLTALSQCNDLRNCSSPSPLPSVSLVANPAGGFDIVNAANSDRDRLFAYRAGGGELMLVTLSASGHIGLATRKQVVPLPELGLVQDNVTLTLTDKYVAPLPLDLSRNTVASVDSAAGSYVRNNVVNFSTGVTRPETLQINQPRPGLVYRVPAGSVPLSDGSGNSTVREFYSLPLRGMGLSVVALTSSNQLLLSARAGN